MKNIIYIFACLMMSSLVLTSQQSNYTNQSKVISSGGGWSGNALYQQFSVVGEHLVNTYVSNSTYNGTLGFIFNDENIIVAPPKRAVLIYPPNNSLLSGEPGEPITISFYWVDQEDVSFNLQVSRSNSFLIKIVDTVVTNNYCEVSIKGDDIYYWRVESSKGDLTTDWSETWKFNIMITGIDDQRMAQLYPNPSSGIVQLIVENELVNGSLVINDLYGRARFRADGINKISAIDLSLLESGVYFVNVSNGKYRSFSKLIKQ